MPQKTNIEWTDYISNPIKAVGGGWGCTKVSPGCAHCFAETINHGFGGRRAYTGSWEFEISSNELWRLVTEPRLAGKKVFVCDMCDLFHGDVSDDQIDLVFAAFMARRDVTFQVLTKRPKRMRDYLCTPGRMGMIWADASHLIGNEMADFGPNDGHLPNVWLGTSVEDQQRADERIGHLVACPAAVRFVSCEPLLGPIDLHAVPWLYGGMAAKGWRGVLPVKDEADDWVWECQRSALQWVIVGGESGGRARGCDVVWIERIIEQCQSSGVPCFVKQLGSRAHRSADGGKPSPLPLRDPKRSDPDGWDLSLRVREFPEEVPA